MVVIDGLIAKNERDVQAQERWIRPRPDMAPRYLKIALLNLRTLFRQNYAFEQERMRWLDETIEAVEQWEKSGLEPQQREQLLNNVRDNIIWTKG